MQQDGIVGFTQEVLSGALRAIVGRMSVEDVIRDRAAFAGQVAEEAEASLSGQGLVLDAFQIQDITTEGSYLEDLGRPEAARAKQEADIAEAVARRAAEQARLKAEEEIAVAQRTFYLKQAEIKAETDEAAGPLAEAAREQEILAEQEKVAVTPASCWSWALRNRRCSSRCSRRAARSSIGRIVARSPVICWFTTSPLGSGGRAGWMGGGQTASLWQGTHYRV